MNWSPLFQTQSPVIFLLLSTFPGFQKMYLIAAWRQTLWGNARSLWPSPHSWVFESVTSNASAQPNNQDNQATHANCKISRPEVISSLVWKTNTWPFLLESPLSLFWKKPVSNLLLKKFITLPSPSKEKSLLCKGEGKKGRIHIYSILKAGVVI